MNKKILVVDDQEDILQLIYTILSNYGYDVQMDQTGEAVEDIKKENPGLIILDINLGDKDGAEICHKLKKDAQTKGIPIILISAKMDVHAIAEDCGAEDYLAKPFRAKELIDKVSKQFSNAA